MEKKNIKADICKNGEKVGELFEGDMVLRKKSVLYLEQTQEWKMEHFFKGSPVEIRKWLKELTPNEKCILFTVSPYVGFTDCCLKHENGNMLTFDDIVELSCLSRGAVSETLNGLLQKDILYKGKNAKERQYFVNPWIFCKGNRINKVLQTMFRNYKIRVLGGKKWKDVKHFDFT